MNTIFIFPVQTDRRGPGSSARCLYNYVHLILTLYTSRCLWRYPIYIHIIDFNVRFGLLQLREYDTVGIANWFFHENSWFGQFRHAERNYHRKLLQKTGCNYLLPFWNCDIFFTAIKIRILKICRKMVEIRS
jgi:hypothetical protein